jgi:hypothetical protein
LLWLSRVVSAHGDDAGEGGLLEAALTISSRHEEAWTDYIDYLHKVEAPPEKWKEAVKSMRAAFHNYPDMLARADALELDTVLSSQGAAAMTKSLKEQNRKLAHGKDGRTDLVLENISTQVQVLINSGNTNAVNDLYKKSLDAYGKDVAAFESLAGDYFDFASNSGKSKEALRNIEASYKRFYGTAASDYFAMKTQARLLTMIAGFYKTDGQDKQADKLQKEADRLNELAAVGQGKLK